MMETQAWIALVIAALYVVGRAAAYVAKRRRDAAEEGRYRAETLLTTGVKATCDAVYEAYVRASYAGVLTKE